MDRRAHHCLAQTLPKACQGLGESQSKSAGVLASRLNPPHAQKTMQSGLKSPDGLSGRNDLAAIPQARCETLQRAVLMRAAALDKESIDPRQRRLERVQTNALVEIAAL